MIKTENFEQVEVSSAAELRSWLEENHAQNDSVWLVTFKKSVPEKYVSTSEVLDELFCFGWIDGIRRKLDEDRTMQLISPRKAEHWAGTYKTRAAQLIAEERMKEPGLQHEGALAFFESINDSSKRFVLRWIKLAKTEKTRASRVNEIAILSAEGKKLKGS